MGSISVPSTGLVYLDANAIIYSIEKRPGYAQLLQPVWQAAQTAPIEIVSSELVLMECLVGPLKAGNSGLASAYEQLFQQPRTRLLPISKAILRQAALLRATTKLRTPDAIHAATAQEVSCTLFVTNDAGFRGLSSLPLVVLDDLLTP